MKRNTYPEMNKLIKLLVKRNIPFEVLAFPAFAQDVDMGLQIFAPSFDEHKIDAVCHWGTYGYEKGLIEIMSDKVDPDGVVGWLTAEEAIRYFEEAVYG